MKVYLFIYRDAKNTNKPTLNVFDAHDHAIMDSNDKYVARLYAFTSKKFERKQFKRSRNMNIFTEVIKEMTSAEYDDFCETYGDAELRVELMNTRTKANGQQAVPVVCTLREADMVLYYPELILNSLFAWDIHSPLYEMPLKKKILDAMGKLSIDYLEYCILDEDESVELRNSSVLLDDISLLIEEYIETFE